MRESQATPAESKERFRQRHVASNPLHSSTKVSEVVDLWEQRLEAKIQEKLRAFSDHDKKIFRGWMKKGWLEHEPAPVRDAIEMMRHQKAKFRLSDMAVTDVECLRLFMKRKIELAIRIWDQQ